MLLYLRTDIAGHTGLSEEPILRFAVHACCLKAATAYLCGQEEAGSVGAEQAKEAADVIQELEHMDVLAVILVNEVIICSSNRCKDCRNHEEGEDCQSAAPNPTVVYSVGRCIVAHQLHRATNHIQCLPEKMLTTVGNKMH